MQGWKGHCGARSPSNSPHAAAVIIIIIVGLNKEDVKWAKYRSNNMCIGRRDGTMSPTGFQMTDLRLLSPVCAPLCVWSVPASNARTRCALMYDIVIIVWSLGDKSTIDIAWSTWTLTEAKKPCYYKIYCNNLKHFYIWELQKMLLLDYKCICRYLISKSVSKEYKFTRNITEKN